jgi:tetratricopeptide (TPR) repeat protein
MQGSWKPRTEFSFREKNMKLARTAVLFALAATWSFLAMGETAAQLSAQGKAALEKGDLEGALQAYQSAARADQEDAEYAQQFAIVRQALMLRQRLETEQDPERWEYMARALHSFYVRNGLYTPALDLATQIHKRLHSETSGLVLAETAFALDKNDVVVKTLSTLEPAHVTPVTQALLGVALSRQGKLDEARQIAQKVSLPGDSAPSAVYAVARLQAATGNSKAAMASLKQVFESLPPSRQEGYRQHAQQTSEFASVAASSEFAKVLQTESKVPESKCSGGSNCANCPNRGKCQHSQQQ